MGLGSGHRVCSQPWVLGGSRGSRGRPWGRGLGHPVASRRVPPAALLKNNGRKEKSPSARPLLEIYSASGLLLAGIPWKSGRLVQLGWTASEDLLCIQEDGTVLIYNLFCEFKRHFSMGNEVLQNHVLEAKVFHTEYGTGAAILTGAHRFCWAPTAPPHGCPSSPPHGWPLA
ncbi:vacuolar protein sorting-associated protein 16 homolog [Dromaius novaehollandiae]|uniref:vacuolar protein sorting-associated protein 16 homolog n=1 Tax=Dromaius novaehollandiae TaxID=8790 RepID=UPI00311F50E1